MSTSCPGRAHEETCDCIPEPIVVWLLVWLGSEEDPHPCGQIVHVDGGNDIILRGDSVW